MIKLDWSLDCCPKCWKNFIRTIREPINRDEWQINSAKYIQAELEKYGCSEIYTRDDTMEIRFKSDWHEQLFILKWG